MAYGFTAPMAGPSLADLAARRDLMQKLAYATQPPPMYDAAGLGLNLGAQALREWGAARAERDYNRAQTDAFGKIAEASKSGDYSRLASALAAIDPQAAIEYTIKHADDAADLARLRKSNDSFFGGTSGGAFVPPQPKGANAGYMPGDVAPAGSGVPLAALGGAESNHGQNTHNPRSGAAGTYQIMPDTWAQYAGQVGAPPTYDKAYEDQVAGAIWNDYTAKATQDLGRAPSGAEAYGYWFFGPGDAPKVYAADDNVPIDSVIRPKSYAANPFLKGLTVGQAKEVLAQKAQQAGLEGPGDASLVGGSQGDTVQSDAAQIGSWLDTLTPDARAYLQQLHDSPRVEDQKELHDLITKHVFDQGAEQFTAPYEMQGVGTVQKSRKTGKVEVLRKGGEGSPTGPLVTLQDPGNGKTVSMHQDDPRAQQLTDAGWLSIGSSQTPYDIEKNLRQEFTTLPEVKAWKEIVPIVKSARSAATRNGKAADLDLVYAVAKVFDPTSVVREGEQILVTKAASLPDRVLGWISYLSGGGQITGTPIANQILAEIETRTEAWRESYESAASNYGALADSYGVKPSHVIFKLDLPKAVSIPTFTDPNDPKLKALPSGSTFYDANGTLRQVP